MTPFDKQVLTLIATYHPQEHIRTIAETAIIEEDRSIFKDQTVWDTYEELTKETPRI